MKTVTKRLKSQHGERFILCDGYNNGIEVSDATVI